LSQKRKKIIGVILAGGKGERMGAFQKQFIIINGKPILAYSIDKMIESALVDKIIVVVPHKKKSYTLQFLQKRYSNKQIIVLAGGRTRRYSSFNALRYIRNHESTCDYVIFHDGVRPLISVSMIKAIIKEAASHGAAVLGQGVLNVIASVKNGYVKKALNPKNLYNTQTPHCYKFKWILGAHLSWVNKGKKFDALENIEIVHRYGKKIRIIDDFYRNMKLTYKQDIVPIQALLKKKNTNSFYQLKNKK
jgi:2-C-methyl-D-erythritol 4-phosphate cytidylyltransferase